MKNLKFKNIFMLSFCLLTITCVPYVSYIEINKATYLKGDTNGEIIIPASNVFSSGTNISGSLVFEIEEGTNNLSIIDYYGLMQNSFTATDATFKDIIQYEGQNFQLTYIGLYGFYEFSSLAGKLTFPSSLKYLGASALEYTNISSVDFSKCSNLTFEIQALANPFLTEIILPSTLTSIPDYLFQLSSIEKISIPNTVNSIGSSIFVSCSLLTSIELSWTSEDQINNLVIDNNWLSSIGVDKPTIIVPYGTKQIYLQHAADLYIGGYDIEEGPTPDSNFKNNLALGLGLGLGIPTIAGITVGTIYTVKKHKGKKIN